MIELRVYHGTPDKKVSLSTSDSKVIYFTNILKVAEKFALCEMFNYYNFCFVLTYK